MKAAIDSYNYRTLKYTLYKDMVALLPVVVENFLNGTAILMDNETQPLATKLLLALKDSHEFMFFNVRFIEFQNVLTRLMEMIDPKRFNDINESIPEKEERCVYYFEHVRNFIEKRIAMGIPGVSNDGQQYINVTAPPGDWKLMNESSGPQALPQGVQGNAPATTLPWFLFFFNNGNMSDNEFQITVEKLSTNAFTLPPGDKDSVAPLSSASFKNGSAAGRAENASALGDKGAGASASLASSQNASTDSQEHNSPSARLVITGSNGSRTYLNNTNANVNREQTEQIKNATNATLTEADKPPGWLEEMMHALVIAAGQTVVSFLINMDDFKTFGIERFMTIYVANKWPESFHNYRKSYFIVSQAVADAVRRGRVARTVYDFMRYMHLSYSKLLNYKYNKTTIFLQSPVLGSDDAILPVYKFTWADEKGRYEQWQSWFGSSNFSKTRFVLRRTTLPDGETYQEEGEYIDKEHAHPQPFGGEEAYEIIKNKLQPCWVFKLKGNQNEKYEQVQPWSEVEYVPWSATAYRNKRVCIFREEESGRVLSGG